MNLIFGTHFHVYLILKRMGQLYMGTAFVFPVGLGLCRPPDPFAQVYCCIVLPSSAVHSSVRLTCFLVVRVTCGRKLIPFYTAGIFLSFPLNLNKLLCRVALFPCFISERSVLEPDPFRIF